MGVLSTSAFRIAYDVETNYAGGTAGAEYAMTAPALGDLTVMNHPAEAPTLGKTMTERVQVRPIGRGANYVALFTKGYKYGEFKYTQYVQNLTWITAAAQAAIGVVPTSYVFHFEIPGLSGALDYFDLFGCVLIDYELSLTPDDFPKETLTFMYYDMKDASAIASLAGVDVAQPKVFKDCSLSIDGDTMTAVVASTTLKVTNTTLDQMPQGKYQRMKPYLIKRDVTVDCEFFDDLAEVLGNNLALNGTAPAAAIKLFTVIVSNGYAALTCTNMYNDEDSTGQIPNEMDIVKHKLSLKMGGDCAVSVA